MPTVASVMAELKKKGTEKGRILYARHGMPGEHVWGVSVADIKVIAKAIKGEQALACALIRYGQNGGNVSRRVGGQWISHDEGATQ